MDRRIITAGITGAAGVALGALGAHYLKGLMQQGLITQDQLNGFETGVRFHLIHAVCLFALALYLNDCDNRKLRVAFRLFFAGILLFSGSLYLLCIRDLLHAGWLKYIAGPATPVGGIVLIAAWIYSATALKKT
jgi:uncharacterized membrane protein YgdD (TMEM256/DUF423 family)